MTAAVLSLYFVLAIGLAPGWMLVPLWLWARWLAERPRVPQFAARTAYALLGVGGILAVGAVAGGFRVLAAVSAGEPIDPSQKARILALGISESMNGGVLVVVVALILVVWLLFGTWRWHWASRARD